MSALLSPAPRAGTAPLVPGAGSRPPPAPPPHRTVLSAHPPLGPVGLLPTARGSELRGLWLGAVRTRGLRLPVPLRWAGDDRPARAIGADAKPPVLVSGPCAAAALRAMAVRGADPRRLALRDVAAVLRDWATARPGGALDRHDPLVPALLVLRPPRLAGLPAWGAPLAGSPSQLAGRLAALAACDPRLARWLPGGGTLPVLWQVLRALPRTASPGEVAFALGLPAGG